MTSPKREAYHPLAYLSCVRNVRLGLHSRTKILNILEQQVLTANEVSEKINMNYRRVLRYLHQLERERYAKRVGDKKPFHWKLTGLGQKRLPW